MNGQKRTGTERGGKGAALVRLLPLVLSVVVLSFGNNAAAQDEEVPGSVVVTDFSVTTAFPTEDLEVAFSVTITNPGDTDVGGFNVAFWKHRPDAPNSSNGNDASQMLVNGLAAGASTTLIFRATYADPGIYTPWVMADSDKVIGELNEEDNRASTWLEVHPLLPDLKIKDFDHVPEPVTAGGAVVFSVTVLNNGATAAGPFTVAFFQNRFIEPSTSDAPTATQNVASLASGAVTVLTFTITAPNPLSGYTAWALADSGNAVTEYKEDNNTGKDVWGDENSPPVIDSELTASTEEAGLSETVTFSVTASDPDGDPLGYFWDFGDGTALTFGSAAAAHAFSAPGLYTVRVIVIDGPFSAVSGTAQVNVLSQKTVNLGTLSAKRRGRIRAILPLPNGWTRRDRIRSTVFSASTGIKRIRVGRNRMRARVTGAGTYRFGVEFNARKLRQVQRVIFTMTVITKF